MFLLVFLLSSSFVFLYFLAEYRRRFAFQQTGSVVNDLVNKNLRDHAFYLWAFSVQWRKIQPRSYFTEGQLHRIVLLMRALPLRKVIREYNRICTIAGRLSPHLSIRRIEEFYEVNRAILIKRILREILHLIPRINRTILKYKGTMEKKKDVITRLSTERRYILANEICVAKKSLKIHEKFHDRVNLFYCRYLKQIQDSLRRENADSREFIDRKISRLEKLAIMWVCLKEKIILQGFNLNISCKNVEGSYLKECDGNAITSDGKKIVIEVKCSWNAVDMAKNKANSIDMQIQTAKHNGFDNGFGVIVGNNDPNWMEYNGQKYLSSVINTLLLYLVNNRGYVCHSQLLINEIRESVVASSRKVKSLLADPNIHVVSHEELDLLSHGILSLFERKTDQFLNDSIEANLLQYCQHAFSLPKDDFVLT